MSRASLCAVLLVASLIGCGGSNSGTSGSGSGISGSGTGSGSGTSSQATLNGAWGFTTGQIGPNVPAPPAIGVANLTTATTSGAATVKGSIYFLAPGPGTYLGTVSGTISSTGMVSLTASSNLACEQTTCPPSTQTLTLSGSLAGNLFTGTIAVSAQGTTPAQTWNVTGYPTPSLTGTWTGTAILDSQSFPISATLTATPVASTDGIVASDSLSGTVTIQNVPGDLSGYCLGTMQIYSLSSGVYGPEVSIDTTATLTGILQSDGNTIEGEVQLPQDGGGCAAQYALTPGTFTLIRAN